MATPEPAPTAPPKEPEGQSRDPKPKRLRQWTDTVAFRVPVPDKPRE